MKFFDGSEPNQHIGFLSVPNNWRLSTNIPITLGHKYQYAEDDPNPAFFQTFVSHLSYRRNRDRYFGGAFPSTIGIYHSIYDGFITDSDSGANNQNVFLEMYLLAPESATDWLAFGGWYDFERRIRRGGRFTFARIVDVGNFVDGAEFAPSLPTSGVARYQGLAHGWFGSGFAAYGHFHSRARINVEFSDRTATMAANGLLDRFYLSPQFVSRSIAGDDFAALRALHLSNLFFNTELNLIVGLEAINFTGNRIQGIANCARATRANCISTSGSWDAQFFGSAAEDGRQAGQPNTLGGVFGLDNLRFEHTGEDGVTNEYTFNFIGAFGARLLPPQPIVRDPSCANNCPTSFSTDTRATFVRIRGKDGELADSGEAFEIPWRINKAGGGRPFHSAVRGHSNFNISGDVASGPISTPNNDDVSFRIGTKDILSLDTTSVFTTRGYLAWGAWNVGGGDRGGFVVGAPLSANYRLPTTGTAVYRGDGELFVGAEGYGGEVEFTATFSDEVTMEGTFAEIARGPLTNDINGRDHNKRQARNGVAPKFNLVFGEATFDTSNGMFTGGTVTCGDTGCTGTPTGNNWQGAFFGNVEQGQTPEKFGGIFQADGLTIDGKSGNIVGGFGAIHNAVFPE